MSIKFLFAGVLFSCAAFSDIHTMIVGGHKIRLPDAMAKFTVGLADSSKTQHCTAALIAPDMALSAAHCVYTGNDAYLIFGPDADADDTIEIPIVNYEAHSSYNPSDRGDKDRGDIVLLHFKKALPSGYSPAERLPSPELLDQIKTVSLAGYGGTDYFPGEPTAIDVGMLRRVDDVPVDEIHFTKTEFTIAKGHGKGTCHGDSGGPAAAIIDGHHYLLGVVSRPHPFSPFDACDAGTTFTRVEAYADWIANTADKLRKSPPTSFGLN